MNSPVDIESIRRCCQDGEALNAAQLKALGDAINDAKHTGKSIDHCFGLRPGWGFQLRQKELRDCLQTLFVLANQCALVRPTPFCRATLNDLKSCQRRFGNQFNTGCEMSARDELLHGILVANNGKIPTLAKIRDDVSKLAIPRCRK